MNSNSCSPGIHLEIRDIRLSGEISQQPARSVRGR
jgi:hypothetical protein